MEIFRAACFPISDSPIYFPTYFPLKTNTFFITSFPLCCIRLAIFPLHSSVVFLSRLSLSQLFHIFPKRDFPDAEFSFSVAFVFSYPLASSSRFLSRGEETPILHLSIREKERDGRERPMEDRKRKTERRKEKGTGGLAQMKFNKISSSLVALGHSIAYTLSRRERPGPLAVTMATQHPAPRDVTAPSICTPLYDYRHHHHHDHHYHHRHYSHHHSPQPLLPPTSSFSSRHRLPLAADV